MTKTASKRTFNLLIIFTLGWAIALFVFGVLHPGSGSDSTLVIDAEIEGGGIIEIFANAKYEKSYIQPIKAGVRTEYRFENLPAEISHIRLDPTDRPQKKVTFFHATFSSHGRKIAEMTPADFAKWQFDGMNRGVGSPTDRVEYTTTTNDPMTWSFNLSWKDSNAQGNFMQDLVSWVPLLLVIGCGLWFLIWGEDREIMLLVLIVSAALHWFGPLYGNKILAMSWAPVSIRNVLGISGYLGSSKLGEEIVVAGSLAAAILAGLFAGMLAFRRSKPAPHTPLDVPFSWIFIAGSIVFYVLASFPHLLEGQRIVQTAHHDITNFDFNNIFTWQYAYEMGWLPFRDYWFPYGGYFNQLGHFKADLLREFALRTFLFSGILLCVYELTRRRRVLTGAILVTLGFFIERGYLLGTKRYLSALIALLLFAAIRKRGHSGVILHTALGIYMGWVFCFEPNQLIYAAVAAVPLWLIHFYGTFHHGKVLKEVVNLFMMTCGFLIVALGYIYLLDKNGQLEGFVEFYRYMSAMAANSSIPAPVSGWYKISQDPSHLLFLLMHILFAVNAYLLARDRFRVLSKGWILTGISALSGLVFLKMILRPYIAEQLMVIVVAGLVFFVVWWSERWNSAQKRSTSFLLGLIVGYGTWSGSVPNFLMEHLSSFKGLGEEVAYALSMEGDHKKERDEFFAQGRFTGIDKDHAELLKFFNDMHLPEKGNSIYVFGDNSYLYTLLKQKPAKYITFYDGGHIWAQKAVIAQLQEERREYVIWDTSFKAFDGVPNVLRVPLLFSFIVTHFVPAQSFGVFEVLVPRTKGTPVDWNYWISKIGNETQLGRLPALLNVSKLSECKVGDDCIDFLKLKVRRSASQPHDILCKVGDYEMHLKFEQRTADKVLYLPLSRIWLWDAAMIEDAMPELSWDTKRFEGAVIKKKRDPALLY